MHNKKINLSLLFVLGLGFVGLHAQEVITTTGGNASGSGGSVSYTIGQIVYSSNTGSNGSVSQGVQQPFEISVISGLDEGEGINLTCSAYPNPTTDFLTLKVGVIKTENLAYQLYDIGGKFLVSNKVEGNETTICMSNLVQSVYFLKLTNNNKEIKTFKIIKN